MKRPDDRRVVDRDDRVAEPEVGDRAVLAARLAQVDDDRPGLVGLELGQDPLQAVVVARPRASSPPAGRSGRRPPSGRSSRPRARGRSPEGGLEVGPAVRQRELVDLLLHLGMIGRGVADHDPGRVAHQDDADRVAPPRVLDELHRPGSWPGRTG